MQKCPRSPKEKRLAGECPLALRQDEGQVEEQDADIVSDDEI